MCGSWDWQLVTPRCAWRTRSTPSSFRANWPTRWRRPWPDQSILGGVSTMIRAWTLRGCWRHSKATSGSTQNRGWSGSGTRRRGRSWCCRVPAAGGQQQRSHRGRVRCGPQVGGPADRMAAGRRTESGADAEARDRVQGAAGEIRPQYSDRRRAGADRRVHGPERCGIGRLVIFDLNPGRKWEERVPRTDPEEEGPPITVWAM